MDLSFSEVIQLMTLVIEAIGLLYIIVYNKKSR